MLRNRDVTVGKCYVNNGRKVAREVTRADEKTVIFNTYHLDTGNSCGSPSECTRQDFTRWADHEATPAEMASLPYQEMDALFRAPQLPTVKEFEHSLEVEPSALQLMQKPTLNR